MKRREAEAMPPVPTAKAGSKDESMSMRCPQRSQSMYGASSGGGFADDLMLRTGGVQLLRN